MRIALIADWLVTLGGAEQTITQMRMLWPEAPLYTTVARESSLTGTIRTTALQPLYRLLGRHQPLLPLMPRALEDLDLRGFDVILSSSHAVGKGIVPPATAVHVCYCHTPMRYAWEMENTYLDDFGVPGIVHRTVKKMLKRLRRWDLTTAKRVDVFLANSTETQRRIERIYGRASTVIHPPVSERFFEHPLLPIDGRGPFLAIGRLVPYKRFDLLIEAANKRGFRLQIAGTGQEESRLRRIAGPTVEFLGYVPDDRLPSLYGHAKAVLFPPYEDAGIVPLEAQASGTPVIAYGKGGARDTVEDGETGLFFEEQTVESLSEALDRFETQAFDPEKARENARRFSAEVFRRKLKAVVEETLDRSKKTKSQKPKAN